MKLRIESVFIVFIDENNKALKRMRGIALNFFQHVVYIREFNQDHTTSCDFNLSESTHPGCIEMNQKICLFNRNAKTCYDIHQNLAS